MFDVKLEVRTTFALVIAVTVAVGCKADATKPASAPAGSPSGSADVAAVDAGRPRTPPKIPEHPNTTLRIRIVTGSRRPEPAPSDMYSSIAMCRPDEQLTGGYCSELHLTIAHAVDANEESIDNETHTFGAGWYCYGNAHAFAFCLSDPSNVPAEVPGPPRTP